MDAYCLVCFFLPPESSTYEISVVDDTLSSIQNAARRSALNHIHILYQNCQTIGVKIGNTLINPLIFVNLSNFILHQTSLDGIIMHEPKQPPFTTADLLYYIVELVVS